MHLWSTSTLYLRIGLGFKDQDAIRKKLGKMTQEKSKIKRSGKNNGLQKM